MNDHREWNRRGLLLGAAFSALPAAAWSQTPPAGRVTEVTGQATAQSPAGARLLKPETDVFVGDRIATGEGARAAMRLGRSTELRLGALARITIDRFIMDAGGVIRLGAGAVLLDKEPAANEISIKSSFGLIAVRGTQVFAGPSNGVFGVLVLRGEVRVSAAGRSVVLGSGQGTDIARIGAPPKPAAAWGAARIAEALASVR